MTGEITSGLKTAINEYNNNLADIAMSELRVIIASGRDFDDFPKLISSCIDILSKTDTDCGRIRIVGGGARGADELGEQFAKLYHYELTRFLAEWDKLGKGAGYARNTEMAKFASEQGNHGVLIAFWDGKSRGTKHMIDTSRKYGLEVHIVNY